MKQKPTDTNRRGASLAAWYLEALSHDWRRQDHGCASNTAAMVPIRAMSAYQEQRLPQETIAAIVAVATAELAKSVRASPLSAGALMLSGWLQLWSKLSQSTEEV